MSYHQMVQPVAANFTGLWYQFVVQKDNTWIATFLLAILRDECVTRNNKP